ncbi:MAG: hypothetical protein K5778_06835 [Bacteroidaceae bacterium]|nr:hypothetical protein [Bacteroidaceae bacterium]
MIELTIGFPMQIYEKKHTSRKKQRNNLRKDPKIRTTGFENGKSTEFQEVDRSEKTGATQWKDRSNAVEKQVCRRPNFITPQIKLKI